MTDADINKKIADVDKDLKLYVDMKIRAVKKLVAPFIWMRKHPFWTIIIFLIIMSAGIWVSHRVSARQIIEATTGVKIHTEDIHE